MGTTSSDGSLAVVKVPNHVKNVKQETSNFDSLWSERSACVQEHEIGICKVRPDMLYILRCITTSGVSVER